MIRRILALFLVALLPLLVGSNVVNPHRFAAAGSGVTWGGVVQTWSGAPTPTAIVVITLSSGVAVNDTVIVRSATRTGGNITGVTDSKGNTWRTPINQFAASGYTLGMVSSQLTTAALVSGDTVTVTYTTATAAVAQGDVCYVTGSTAQDSNNGGSVSSGSTATSLTYSNTTTATNGVIVAMAGGSTGGASPSAASWTQDGLTTGGQFSWILFNHVAAPTVTTYTNLVSWTGGTSAGWMTVSFK